MNYFLHQLVANEISFHVICYMASFGKIINYLIISLNFDLQIIKKTLFNFPLIKRQIMSYHHSILSPSLVLGRRWALEIRFNEWCVVGTLMC